VNVSSDGRTPSRPRIAAAAALVAFAVMTFATRDAVAQIQSAPVVAPVSSQTPYLVYLAADCLTGSNFCRFATADVPAGQLLTIQRVACQGWHASTTPPNFVTMAELRNSADQFLQRIDFLKTTYTTVNTNSVWYISEQTLMFIPEAHRLRISLNSASTGVGSYGCTVSGYLSVQR
jgi:hypothetical protein